MIPLFLFFNLNHLINFFLFERKKFQKRSKKPAVLSLIYILKACFRVLLSAITRLKERGCGVAITQGRVIHVGKIGLSQTCSRSVKKVRIERRFSAVKHEFQMSVLVRRGSEVDP